MRGPTEPGAGNSRLARRSVAFFICFLSLMFCLNAAGSENPRDKAWGVLEIGLSEHKTSKRAAAVQALGLMQGDARAIDLAEKALADKKPAVRAAAATALGQIGTRASIPTLKIGMMDRQDRVAFAAAGAVATLGDPAGYDLFYMALTGERKSSEGWITDKKRLLTNPSAWLLLGYGSGLGYIPYAGYGVAIWRDVSKDYSTPMRLAALNGLSKDKDIRIGRELIKLASDKHPAVRIAALMAIANHGDPNLVSAIISHLTDKKAEVRYAAAAAILRLSGLDVTQTAAFD